MPVDATIALAGRPPVVPELDLAKTYLTLGQLKYLSAEAGRTAAQTGLVQTQGAAAQADLAASNRLRGVDPTGGAPLSTLGTAPAAGGPPFAEGTLAALPAGGATPPPGAGAAAPPAAAPRLTAAELSAQYMRADPIKGLDIARGIFERERMALENQKGALELGIQDMHIASAAWNDVTDDASAQRANALIGHVTGRDTSHLPQTFSPEAKQQITNFERTAQARIDQTNKELDRAIEENKAGSQRLSAEAAKTAAGASETTAGAAATTAATGAAAEARAQQENVYTPTTQGLPPAQPRFGAPRADQAQPGTGATTLPQAEQRNAEKNAFLGSQPVVNFQKTRLAYGDLQAGAKLKTGAGDKQMMYGINKIWDPQMGVQPTQVSEIANLGTLSERAQRELARMFTSGQGLSDPVRQEILAAGTSAYQAQATEHQSLVRRHRELGTANGMADVHLVYPDLSQDAAASPAFGKPPPKGATQVEAVTSVTLKELQETVDLANKQGKKTAQGKPYTMDYLKKYFEQNGVTVRP